MNTATSPASKELAIEAILRDPATYEKAALIPSSEHGGRPRLYPDWAYIMYNELVSHFQTGGKVQTELGDPRTWRFVVELAGELLPPEMQPPSKPMRWHIFKYVKNTYLAREDVLAEYRRIHREGACALAREAGNFPDGGGGFTIHPTEAITTGGDGKVVASRSKAKPGARRRDKRSGKLVKRRTDPDKALYHEGDGAEAWGLKYLPVHTRTRFGRVVLDIPYVRGVSPTDEADVTVESLRQLRPLLPGPFFHVHDGALTSEHHQVLLTELGTVAINRTRAKRNPKIGGKAIGRREPDQGVVERKVLARRDGIEEPLLIHEVDGDLGLMELTENGDEYFVPLEPTRLIMNRNRDPWSKPFRPYVGLRLPAEIALRTGKREVTVAIYQTAEDKRRGYLRTAHVRAIGPANKDFSIYGRMRADSESLNGAVEASLYRHHRAHSDGWARQQVDMLGFGGLTNALTRERLRRAALSQAA